MAPNPAMPAPSSVKLADLTLEQKELLASPYGFAKYYLGLPVMDAPERRKVGECRNPETGEIYYEIFDNDKQKQALNLLDTPGKVSIRTANGAGKTTTIIPGSVLWAMAVHPRTKVVITSGVERQVRAQLFPALQSRQTRLAGWVFTDNQITAPNGSVAVGFATNDGGRFEGWHGNKNPLYDLAQHDGPLMMVVDEAKTVAQTIYDAIDRCTYQWLLKTSSCGGSAGEFYKSHTSNARFFRTLQITAGDCPHADHAKNLELILKRGLQDPLVRSKIFSEFMAGAEGSVINIAWVDRARNQPPAFMPGTRRIFCDFAAGGDENAIADRQGNRVRLVAAWREKDTMRMCGQVINHLRELGITQAMCPQIVAGDNGGLGKVVMDRLAEAGWHFQRVNNGGAADEKTDYENHSAETWFCAAKKLEMGQLILENVDDITAAQLTGRLGFTPSDGKRWVESKEDMKKRGLDSPDRADALVGCIREAMNVAPITGFMGGPNPDLGLLDQMLEENGMTSLPGAWTG
jgi:phage terminase large subunit